MRAAGTRTSRGPVGWSALLAVALVAVPSAGQEARDEPAERTPDVIFVPTPEPVVERMLQVARVSPGDLLYDLGCGDGRLAIAAARDRGARSVCVDIDPVRIRESRENAAAAGVKDRVRIVQGDLFEMDFRDATVVTLYLLPTLNVKLRPILFEQLRPGSRVVSHDFDMGDWRPDASYKVDGHDVYFWVIPAPVAGTWRLTEQTGDGPREHVLELQQSYQSIRGTFSSGSAPLELDNPRLEGATLSFSVGANHTRRFEGQVRDGRMELVEEGTGARLEGRRTPGPPR